MRGLLESARALSQAVRGAPRFKLSNPESFRGKAPEKFQVPNPKFQNSRTWRRATSILELGFGGFPVPICSIENVEQPCQSVKIQDCDPFYVLQSEMAGKASLPSLPVVKSAHELYCVLCEARSGKVEPLRRNGRVFVFGSRLSWSDRSSGQ